MKLINKKLTYDFTYEKAEDPKPVFTLRKLTTEEVMHIGDATGVLDENNRILFKGGTTSLLKLSYSLVKWVNMTDDNGKDVPCTDETKKLLPPDVTRWLVGKIDELNKLSIGVPEDERKNS